MRTDPSKLTALRHVTLVLPTPLKIGASVLHEFYLRCQQDVERRNEKITVLLPKRKMEGIGSLFGPSKNGDGNPRVTYLDIGLGCGARAYLAAVDQMGTVDVEFRALFGGFNTGDPEFEAWKKDAFSDIFGESWVSTSPVAHRVISPPPAMSPTEVINLLKWAPPIDYHDME